MHSIPVPQRRARAAILALVAIVAALWGLFVLQSGANALTITAITPVNDVAGAVNAAYDISYSTPTSGSTSSIIVVFPAGYTIGATATVQNAAGTAGKITNNGTDENPATVSTNPGTRTVTVSFGPSALSANSTFFRIVTGITNPTSAGVTGTFSITTNAPGETPDADNTVTIVAGAASATTSTISGGGPVIANGVDTSAITITLRDANSNLIAGVTPTFSATGTGNTNGACSASNASGVSSCTLASTVAQVKTIETATPVVTTGGATVTFDAGTASATTSTITGTGPVIANGVATSAITTTLRDAANNAVAGVTPTFSATGTGNTNGACSVSNASGVSSCTLASTVAQVKTIEIATPVVTTGGATVTFASGSVSATTSTISGSGPVTANGVATSAITITLRDGSSNLIAGVTPTFSATGTGNTNGACGVSNASGVSSCTLASTVAQLKTIEIATPVVTTGGATVTFVAGAASPTTSTISGSSPVTANGVATSAITITLRDANSNLVAGVTPTFSATGTGNTNGACGASNASGVSSCTLASSVAQVKTIEIATPVVTTGGATVSFVAGSASGGTSTITGVSGVQADGVSTSTITITLRDASSNAVAGVTPTFTASGSGNSLGACSAGTASGVSTCTLSSSVAQVKTLGIATPVVTSAGATVTFIAGAVSAANSTISGTSPVVADGVATSTVTVTLLDGLANPVVGVSPTFSATGSGNSYGACSATNGLGVATCTLASTAVGPKALSIATPVTQSGSSVTFVVGPPSASTSTIFGSGPIPANGVTPSMVTITLLDVTANPVSGVVPTFSASGAGNAYSACTASNASGVSSCTMTSTVNGTKVLSIVTPVGVAGGSVLVASSTTAVTSSNNPALNGAVVTFTVTVTAAAPGSATPTGAITLRDGAVVVATLPLAGGQAAYTANLLSAGNHLMTAQYTGSSTLAASTSATLDQLVASFGAPLPFVPTAVPTAPPAASPTASPTAAPTSSPTAGTPTQAPPTQAPPTTTPPTAAPSPTVGANPSTSLLQPVLAGATRVEVASQAGFKIGDTIRFGAGLPNQEDNTIAGFGSFILATPLKYAHAAGELVTKVAAAPVETPVPPAKPESGPPTPVAPSTGSTSGPAGSSSSRMPIIGLGILMLVLSAIGAAGVRARSRRQ